MHVMNITNKKTDVMLTSTLAHRTAFGCQNNRRAHDSPTGEEEERRKNGEHAHDCRGARGGMYGEGLNSDLRVRKV
jgi:hypothetical protein